jgi:hypothetical protein
MNSYPVRVTARPDVRSRWLWLVKWVLLVPHVVALAVLWVAFGVLTLVAYVAVLATGRYPAGIADFNVGVLRWTWRVGYYGYWALGTDRYPPFTLADVPDYPARLELTEPPHPKRWLPLVAWLFALPHILIVGALYSGGWQYATGAGDTVTRTGLGLVGLVVLITGLVLLFTGRYPAGLHDLLVGAARWSLRTTAYVALLTGTWPPLRFDQGGDEPTGGPRAAGLTGVLRTGGVGPATGAPADLVKSPPAGPVRPNLAARLVALVAGVVLLLAGGGAAVTGGALLALHAGRDTAGFVSTRAVDLSSASAAVVATDLAITPTDTWGRPSAVVDAVRITATGHRATPLFVGVARQTDVDTWLAGTAYDRMTGMQPGMGGMRGPMRSGMNLQRMPGLLRPVPTPAAQEFWLASATGTGTVSFEWAPASGRYALVLANADGSLSVSADTAAAARVPALRAAGAGTLTIGLLVTVLAGLLILYGALGLAGYAGPAHRPAAPQRPRTGPDGSGPPPGPAPGPPGPDGAAHVPTDGALPIGVGR